MEHDAVEIARLSAQVELGLKHIDSRFDHTARELADIKAEVRRTNGRVTVLETHNAILAGNPDKAMLTPGTVKWYLAIIVGTIGATMALLRFFGHLT